MMDDNELRNLSDYQRDLIRNFSDITNITDMNLCRSILQNNDWNLELSVDNFVQNRHNHQSHQSLISEDTSDRSDDGNIRAPVSQNNGIIQSFIGSLKWLYQYAPTYQNMQQERNEVSRFCDMFRQKYGEDGPPFLDMPYRSAIEQAFSQSKFLFLYLHSPLHEDTDRYCR